MAFGDNHERSILPKALIAIAIFSSIILCGHLVFTPASEILPRLKAYKIDGKRGVTV